MGALLLEGGGARVCISGSSWEPPRGGGSRKMDLNHPRPPQTFVPPPEFWRAGLGVLMVPKPRSWKVHRIGKSCQ